jgi:hypothetical protein
VVFAAARACGSVVDRQTAKAALELLAIDDRAQAVVRDRLVARHEPEVRRPAPLLPPLRIAGMHEEPVRPGVRARRVSKARKLLPDGEQRLLRRVLGEVDVAQDPARHGKKPIRDLGANEGECPLSPRWARITRSVFMPLPL